MTKIKRLNLVLKSLRLCFYVLFLVASRDTCVEAIDVANICINTFRKLGDVNAIIAFVNVTNSSYVDRSLSDSRTRSLYLLKF